MKEHYRKHVEDFLRKKSRKQQTLIDGGISIITCTNKGHTLDNIITNFNQQDFQKKELIIIINKDNIDLKSWLEKIKCYDNIRIFKLSEKTSLGKCLNYGVEKANHQIIAKFDDDDYYGPKYLSDSIKAFNISGVKIVVKAANFVYFVEKKILAIRTPREENKFVSFGNGSTLIFKKEIFNKVKFKDVSISEDVFFCQDCIRNNMKIYSTNKYHHVYFRHPSKKTHTWQISDNEFISRYCKVIGQVEDYIGYANKIGTKV